MAELIRRFNWKEFNPEVFGAYVLSQPNEVLTNVIESGAIDFSEGLGGLLSGQAGGNYISVPFTGGLGDHNDVQVMDGTTDIDFNDIGTSLQGRVVVTVMKGWQTKSFETVITGNNFMQSIAARVSGFIFRVHQGIILRALRGVVALEDMAAYNKVTKFAREIGATDINTAVVRSVGDHQGNITLGFMNSAVALQLQNQNVLTFLKMNQANGLQTETRLASVNGIMTIVNDEVKGIRFEAGSFAKTEDKTILADKTYYTKNGEAYEVKVNPVATDLPNLFEVVDRAFTEYPTYLLGRGAIGYQQLGIEHEFEYDRNSSKFGGLDMLMFRQRRLLHIYGLSYKQEALKGKTMPALADLENPASWEFITDTKDNVWPTKTIPIATLFTRVYDDGLGAVNPTVEASNRKLDALVDTVKTLVEVQLKTAKTTADKSQK